MLLIDIGNTRIKAATLTSAGITPVGERVHAGAPASALSTLVAAAGVIDSVWIASVHRLDIEEEVNRSFQADYGLLPHWVVSPAAGWGVINGYRDPATLGVDRFLALVGARQHTGMCATCVIDCGTAVTIDVIGADGVHQGGLIAPGLNLMRHSLQRQTARLAVESSLTDCVLLADSTAGGIASGCVHGVVGLITYVLASVQRRADTALEIVLTGGDAEQLIHLLPANTRRIDDLVLQGLAVVALAGGQG